MAILPASVIVCTHNRAELLRRVIAQLSAQDYPSDSFELIIVDNCSTDDTPQIVQRFIPDRAISFRYLRENHLGVTFARNRGAEEARYPYLAYLDDDCSIGVDWLSQIMSGFDLDEQASIVAGHIVLDYDNQRIPAWLGEKSERWLGTYNFPGSQPRLLDNPVYVCEGNMAIKRQVWKSTGGFLGMDRFSSPHVAAQEIVYLLDQVKRQGGKVAFVPGAIARHHTAIPTQRWMLMRAYWHGVSDGILDYLLKHQSWLSLIYQIVLDTVAMFIFLFLAFLFLLMLNKATSMYHLLRATARFGRLLSELRLKGDWHRARLWASTQGVSLVRKE
jgi:glucosyl-dolichyl phosphate glucuronosyltransferase